MSTLSSSLNASVQALSAQSRAIEISGKNLANVDNTNYARQRIVFGDRGTIQTSQGAESTGLQAVGVEQIRDALLDRQVVREASLSAAYTAQQSGLQRAQAGLGESIDRSQSTTGTSTSSSQQGLGTAIDDFFNAFQGFASSPTDSGQRETLVQSAQTLTDRFQQTDQSLAQVQSDLNTQASTDVDTANNLLSQIADLNAQIGRFEFNSPGSAVDLRDQRQALLEQLGGKISIDVTDSNASQVQVTTKDANGNNVVLIDHASVSNSLSFAGNSLSAGNPPVALAPTGGSIKGALDARDGGVQTLRNNLDSLAAQFVTSVNAIYNPTGATGDFFNASGQTAGTIAISSSVTASSLKASDGGAAGDNTIAQGIANLASTVFSTSGGDHIDGTIAGAFSASVSRLGQTLATANTNVQDQSNIETLVRTQRDGVSGVDLDEEMANLMMYQRAYQASSRVFTTIDSLMDQVINHLGVGN